MKDLTPKIPLWSYQFQRDSKLIVRTRKDLEFNLINRALKHEAFRGELVANPKAVVEKYLGVALPEELEINVLEETQDTIYIILPCNPYEGVSEEEIQASLGMTYEDVASWVLKQQRNTFLDEEGAKRIIIQSWTDTAFKQCLFNNTKEMLLMSLGINIPDGIQVCIKSETPNTLYIVLPKPIQNPGELEIHDLEMNEVKAFSDFMLEVNVGSLGLGVTVRTGCADELGSQIIEDLLSQSPHEI